MDRKQKIGVLRQYFLRNLCEDRIDGTVFDCDVLDALDMLEEKVGEYHDSKT